MRFDFTDLNHELQRKFFESVKDHLGRFEDNYYKVFYDPFTDEFLLIKIGYVVPNKLKEKRSF